MFYTARVINCEDGKAVWPKQTVPAEVVMLPSSPVRPSFPIRPFSSQLIRWKTIEVVCNGVRGDCRCGREESHRVAEKYRSIVAEMKRERS